MTRRRHCLIGLLLAVGAIGHPWAQPARLPRIGVLASGSPLPAMPQSVEALIAGLRERGYVDGRTVQIEFRWAEGRVERLPELAAELVARRVDLIVATGDAPIRAAKAATGTIPIVMATSNDAVGAGFVASLARPGGNVTGMTAMNPELGATRLQLLHELVPRATRIAVVWNPEDRAHGLDLQALQAAAPQLALSLLPLAIQRVDELDDLFERLLRLQADALVVLHDTTTFAVRDRILTFAAQRRLPAMYEAREWAAAGGLVSYGVTHADLFRQSAGHVDRILKGARPADLPVEQPTLVRLTVNLRTAAGLGLVVPPSVRLRADELIE